MDLAYSFPLVAAGLAQPRAHCGSPAAREGREEGLGQGGQPGRHLWVCTDGKGSMLSGRTLWCGRNGHPRKRLYFNAGHFPGPSVHLVHWDLWWHCWGDGGAKIERKKRKLLTTASSRRNYSGSPYPQSFCSSPFSFFRPSWYCWETEGNPSQAVKERPVLEAILAVKEGQQHVPD